MIKTCSLPNLSPLTAQSPSTSVGSSTPPTKRESGAAGAPPSPPKLALAVDLGELCRDGAVAGGPRAFDMLLPRRAGGAARWAATAGRSWKSAGAAGTTPKLPVSNEHSCACGGQPR